MLLNRRIKPFLLRRTKDNVAKELPPKTEMVRKVELTGRSATCTKPCGLPWIKRCARKSTEGRGAQPDRHPRSAAQAAPGVLRSAPGEIPAGKKQSAGSAKLVDLMQMVEDLLDEGRKILVFSQFTSMLELIEEELERATFPTPC
jgi:SNF2 family DNA or RNA helicase